MVAAVTNGMVEAVVAAVAAAAVVAEVLVAAIGVIVDMIILIVIDGMMIGEAEVEAIVITKTAVINAVEVTNMDQSETKTTTQAAEV